MLLESAGDVLLWLDADGRIADAHAHDHEVSEAARRDWRGRRWLDTVTVESQDKVAQLIAAAQSASVGRPEWRQVNHPLQGGHDLPVLYTAIRLSGGPRSRTPLSLIAIGRDLRATEALQRRLVESQQAMERDYWRFREAEARYRSLFQSSTEAVLIVDAATLRVIEANPAAQSLLDGSPASPRARKGARAVGGSWTNLFTAEAAEPLTVALAAVRSSGSHDPVIATLAASARTVSVSISIYRENQSSFLLVRLVPRATAAAGRSAPAGSRDAAVESAGPHGLMAAFVRGASDAVAFTDASGRVVSVNRSFARLAQLSSEDQARGHMLDRWLGRTGVEISVLLANLKKDGSAGLFTTQMRGALGMSTEVEIAASSLDPPDEAVFAFSVRDVSRRLAAFEPGVPELPPSVPTSVKQLTELVGRVPLKQILAETSDLIERLSIESALVITRDNRALAAQLLGLSRQSLYVKLRRFGLGGLGPDDPD
jgi:transcriptional regulator PpsR